MQLLRQLVGLLDTASVQDFNRVGLLAGLAVSCFWPQSITVIMSSYAYVHSAMHGHSYILLWLAGD
jgi:hypothetical protein